MATKRRQTGRRSPAMQQFFRAKEQYPDALLFFRMGDFYEMFFEDAVVGAELLDIALTSRGTDEDGVAIPMAGVPHHAVSGYVARLIEQGQQVALCEQMEDPSKVKGVVPREVVRVVTPGLVLDTDALDARVHNYLTSVCKSEAGFGLAVLELSTLELRACQLAERHELTAEMLRLSPRELLLHDSAAELRSEIGALLPTLSVRAADPALADHARADAALASVLEQAAGQGGPGEAAVDAAASALGYAQRSQPSAPLGVSRIAPYDPGQSLLMDEAAVRNLELVSTLSGERKGSLLSLIDETRTAMGARTLRQRLLSPLSDLSAIRRRHDQVEALTGDSTLRQALRAELTTIGDLERLSTRCALGVATPRDLGAIRDSLAGAAAVAELIGDAAQASTDDAIAHMCPEDPCADLAARLAGALEDEPPVAHNQGGIFRAEHDARIGELRELSRSGKDVILELEARERERTGIPSLKVKYTRVFGYYIEISKSRLDRVPDDYRRKQTVATGERFTTEALDEVQGRILNADERLKSLEAEMFEALRSEIGAASPRLRRLASELANVDVQASLSECAQRHGYTRPELDRSESLELVEARHPIVERMVASGRFVPNDVRLDADAERLMVITGPNMAGKSTAMRQVALCVILAQAGGFVPAARARIGLVDRIYTRVGASDNVAQGESTFMVEMRETASILHGATRRSLVVLDEIGRGTSTYDGLAIAWAVAEHLHDAIGCRAMFATHYHELCELARTRPGVVNFNVAAKEYGEEVVFLHKLVPGPANRSYGVAVARLAGVPEIVLARAKAMLGELEAGGALPSGAVASLRGRDATGSAQLDMFEPVAPEAPPPSAAEQTLREIDVDRMTPVEALVALARLKGLLPPE